jgi:restriction endonuclease Mrr
MKDADLEYANMVAIVKSYADKGRPISVAFLNWFLEHIYRLDQVSAEDAICDKTNDRGIDGLYVDTNQLEIHVLQSRTKQNGTIGYKDLREFSGTLNQLRTKDALNAFMVSLCLSGWNVLWQGVYHRSSSALRPGAAWFLAP